MNIDMVAPIWNRECHNDASRTNYTSLPFLHLTRQSAVDTYVSQGVLVIANLLRPAMLKELHVYLMESTIFHTTDKPSYVGSYMTKSFQHPLLILLVDELRVSMSMSMCIYE